MKATPTLHRRSMARRRGCVTGYSRYRSTDELPGRSATPQGWTGRTAASGASSPGRLRGNRDPRPGGGVVRFLGAGERLAVSEMLLAARLTTVGCCEPSLLLGAVERLICVLRPVVAHEDVTWRQTAVSWRRLLRSSLRWGQSGGDAQGRRRRRGTGGPPTSATLCA